MKKLFTAALAVAALTMITGCTKKEASNGKVLNIYCWNEEFQGRFNDYYAAKLPVDVTVNWMITQVRTVHIRTNLMKHYSVRMKFQQMKKSIFSL